VSALERVRALFPPSRVVRSPSLSRAVRTDVYLKLENELPTGSFKVRGAYVALRAAMARHQVAEVVAASTGNHGAAVSWAARQLGVGARIFVPLGANRTKTARIASLGAVLTEVGADIEGSRRAAEAHAAATGAFLLDDATNADVTDGAGTIGAELIEQLPAIGTVIVPVGDSALIRGVASAVKGVRRDVRIIGVQARTAPAYHDSWRTGRVVTTETADTIADGLATTTPTAPNVEAVRRLVDEMVLVTDDELIGAMRVLREHDGIVAEPAAAAPVSVILRAPVALPGPVVAIVSGGNVAPEVERRAWPTA